MNTIKIESVLNAVCIEENGLKNIEKLLTPFEISYDIIYSIYEVYKEDSCDEICSAPYIIGEKFNIPLNACDQIAYNCGISGIDNERVTSLILNVLYNAASSGHTYLTINQLIKSVKKKSEYSVYKMDIPNLCISDALMNRKLFYVEENRVFLKKYRDAELSAARNLLLLKNVSKEYTITEHDIDTIEQEIGVHYGKDQRNAFHILDTNGVKILDGGPGTGKSTFVRGLIALFKRKNPGALIELCAPTGRAAKRLAELAGQPAKTIHKLMDLRPFGQGEISVKDKNNPIEADCIIVDESSMVDIELLALLLSAVKFGTLLAFVGDVNQLPSVGPGNVFRDMINSNAFPVFRLTENFRQGNEGSIYDNSKRILNGKFPVKSDDFLIYRAKDEYDAYNALCRISKILYDKDNPFNMQIIEPSRKGVAGTFKMNQYLHNETFYERFPATHDSLVDGRPMIGDKIIFCVTNYKDGYTNGEIGIITSLTASEITVWNDMESFTVPISAMHDIELAYSITIHKSQGSEADDIIIYLPDKMKHMINRSLFYTAVTRAKKSVHIVYTGDALRCAIENIEDTKRQTGLIALLSI